jgi:hypothetical protein
MARLPKTGRSLRGCKAIGTAVGAHSPTRPQSALVAIATVAERLASLALVLALLRVAGLISAFLR